MKFMNDWTALALALGLICGGLLAGRKLGLIATWWLAGGAWLAFRLADRLWKPAVIEMRASFPALELANSIPLTYGLLFSAMLIPTLVMLVLVRPKREVVLPAKADEPLGVFGGLCAGVLVLLAVLQAHVMHPVLKETMPRALGMAAPVLTFLGQQHAGATPAAPAGQPAPKTGG